MLTTKQLIDRYDITQYFDRDGYKDGIRLGKTNVSTAEETEIKQRIPEIVKYLAEQREAENTRAQKRQAKIDAIDGLNEIKAARRENEIWQDEQERLFEQGDPRENRFGKAPNDIKAMREAHPKADAYLTAESVATSSNDEKAAIGQDALNAIIDDPENYNAAITKMNGDLDQLARRWEQKLNAWD